jgi:hypothetical protein
MFGIDTKRLKQLSSQAQSDNVSKNDEITFEDIVENYKLFMKLTTLIETIANAKELKLKNLQNVVEVLTEDMDEEEYEEFVELVLKLLFYLKVSQSAIDDLLDEDDEISSMELENLIELIIERMGDNDLYEFVAYAIHNPDLPDDIDTDSIQMDWAFYNNEKKCLDKAKELANESNFEHKCFKGYSDGKLGFWLYPKDFEHSTTKGVSGKYHKSKKSINNPTRHWGEDSRKKWIKSMKKHTGNSDFGEKDKTKQLTNDTGA